MSFIAQYEGAASLSTRWEREGVDVALAFYRLKRYYR